MEEEQTPNELEEDLSVSTPDELSKPKLKKKPKKASLVINVYSWATPLVGLIMLIAGLLLGYIGRPLLEREPEATPIAAVPTQATVGNSASSEELMTFLTSQARHFKGNPDAPVTLIEFSDFQWPYCGQHATGAGRQIDTEYVESGEVQVIYWHVAFLGQESQWAAEASECAADQNAFWEYHDLLFEKQSGENQGIYTVENLKGYAVELNLDTQAFNECFDSGKHTTTVNTDTQIAQQIGATSTPAFIINGQPLLGAQPFDVFQQYIETALASPDN